ncbi:MAG: hypothetical protein PHF11_01670 [Candidatus Omnitrophica bacterium]|nr:hypothetical protein [Candidatus Omnitrophota bacterium]
MKLKTGLILVVMIFSAFVSVNSVFSQDEAAPAANPAAAPQAATQEPQWVWAEVVSIDSANHQMNVKYLDYEADTEKEMIIAADDNTTYENLNSFSEIKPQDTVSVDYIVTADGKNIAKNINVEKPEGMQPMPDKTMQEAPQAQSQTLMSPPAEETAAVNAGGIQVQPQGQSNTTKEEAPVPQGEE